MNSGSNVDLLERGRQARTPDAVDFEFSPRDHDGERKALVEELHVISGSGDTDEVCSPTGSNFGNEARWVRKVLLRDVVIVREDLSVKVFELTAPQIWRPGWTCQRIQGE